MDKPSDHRIRWILGSVAGLLLVGLAASALAAWRHAAAADATLAGREFVSIRRSLALAGEVAAAELLPLVAGDEQAQKIAVGRDLPWLRSVFGTAVFPKGEDEYAVLVAPDGRPIFSSLADGPPALEDAAPVLEAAGPLVERVRRAYRNSVVSDPADATRFRFKAPASGAMVRAIYEHDVVAVAGQPALVTVIAIQPDSAALLRPEDPTVLVDVRDLGGKAAADLGRAAQVDDLRIVPVPRSVAPNPDGEILRDSSGQPAAVALWSRIAPARGALAAALPALVAVLLLAGSAGLAGAMARRRLADRIAAQDEALLRAARHDGATGLANRAWFRSRIEAALREAHETPFAVVLADVDDLAVVNDTLGQEAGDAVVAAVAKRLLDAGGVAALAARLGGDGFGLVTPALESRAAVGDFAASLSAALGAPVPHRGHAIPVTVSLGAAWAPQDGAAADRLMRHAHLALLRAKKEGRGRCVVFDPVADAALSAALAAAEESLAALKKTVAAPVTTGDTAAPAPSRAAG